MSAIVNYSQVTENQHEELQQLRKHLRSCFDQLHAYLMPHPGLKVSVALLVVLHRAPSGSHGYSNITTKVAFHSIPFLVKMFKTLPNISTYIFYLDNEIHTEFVIVQTNAELVLVCLLY